MNRGDWLRIKVDFEDEPPTLLLVDLVRFEDAPAILREEILEGASSSMNERARLSDAWGRCSAARLRPGSLASSAARSLKEGKRGPHHGAINQLEGRDLACLAL